MKKTAKYIFASMMLITTISTSAHDHATHSDGLTQHMIDGDKLTREEIYSLQTPGWVIFKYQMNSTLANFSNNDYILFHHLNCQDKAQKPSFYIEFNNNYRDGTYRGIDFASSSDTEDKIIKLLVDGNDVGNPFKDYDKAQFDEFIQTLKQSKTLTMQFYDEETEEEYASSAVVSDAAGQAIAADASAEPETKKVLKLNREIVFQLKNSELLDTDCK